MDSLIKYTPESLINDVVFVEHILSIIDTKLQFVEYRTSKTIKSLVKESNIYTDSDLEKENITIEVIENEKVLHQIEEYSRTTSLLLLMRVNLFGKNASLIFNLLSNDKFLEYSDIELEKKLINSL